MVPTEVTTDLRKLWHVLLSAALQYEGFVIIHFCFKFLAVLTGALRIHWMNSMHLTTDVLNCQAMFPCEPFSVWRGFHEMHATFMFRHCEWFRCVSIFLELFQRFVLRAEYRRASRDWRENMGNLFLNKACPLVCLRCNSGDEVVARTT
jgi:hypothetical protein